MGSWIESSQGRVRAGLIGLWLALSLIGVGTVGAAEAAGATAAKSGATLNYTAAAGETNQAVISVSGANYVVDDPGATITAGAGCTPVDSNTVNCATAGVTGITADAGNLNDLVWVTTPTASTVFGGDGNDSLIGHNAADVLIGCAGNDNLTGGAGSDQLFDGLFCSAGGNDTFDGGTGADAIFGGPGVDMATYASRSAAVNVSLDDSANDGEGAEQDNVHQDVENVTGGSGPDSVTGSPVANLLRGGNGEDLLVGERPADQDPDAGGNDDLFGDAGADALAGGDGNNDLVGGTGNDVLHGSSFGADQFDAGSGADEIRALDGVIDAVNCGTEVDFGVADLDDVVSPSCEQVELSSFFGDGDFLGDEFPLECLPDDLPAEEPTIFADDGLGTCLPSELGACATLRIVRRPVSLHKGVVGVRIKLRAAASGVCRAKLRLEALIDGPGQAQRRKLKIGAEPFSLRPGNTKRFDVQVSRAGRRLVHREDHISAKVGVFTRGADSSKVASAVIRIGARHR